MLDGLHGVSVLALVCLCTCVPSFLSPCTHTASVCTWIYPHWHYCITLTPTVIKCDKLEGAMKKKNEVSAWQLLNLPVSAPSSSSDVLLVCHIAHIFICWLAVMRDSRAGAVLHVARCNAWVWYCHICYLPYRCGGGVFVSVVYLFVLLATFKGFIIKVLISWRKCNSEVAYSLCFRLSSDALSHKKTF